MTIDRLSIIFLATVTLTNVSRAADLVFPSVVERNGPVTAIYRMSHQASGNGQLAVKWTDVFGRVVEDRTIPVQLTDETEIRFPLDLSRTVTMVNEVNAHLSFEGVNKKGEKDTRDEQASASFIARPPERTWSDYVVIMWQPHTAEQFAKLTTLGINAGQYSGKARTPPEFLLKNDLRWYAENLATDFYSEYHRYRPDRSPSWSFTQAKELYKKDTSGKEAFKRHPSFSDPEWLKKIHDRLVEATRIHAPYRPVFYDLADESGIADLAAFWDFDFSDESLGEMRDWLKERYGTLAALNTQWATSFVTWDAVTPETTSEAMKRTDDNFSSWADHKDWMDTSFARALKMGVDAIQSVDPEAYVAIAGGQMPGWGGYDYYRLSQVLTAIEPYDIGNNIEILRSLNPRIAMVTTAFARGDGEKHRIWYEALHGARGNLIWDDKAEHISRDGTIGARGREVAPYYNELRNGIGALLINSVRQSDPIAIHYSQASMRTEWMVTQKPKGEAWINRSSSTERKDSDFLRLRESYCRLIEDLGLQYKFVAYGQVEAGELLKGGYRVLILPHSSALSAGEAAGIRAFVDQGGLLITDGDVGTFDEHSRRLPNSSISGISGSAQRGGKIVKLSALSYAQDRLTGKEGPLHQEMYRLLNERAVRPEFAVVDDAGRPVVGVETHKFRNGGVTIVGLLSNPEMRVDDLGPAEFKSNERFAKPRSVRLLMPAMMYVYDIRKGKALGQTKELRVSIDPYEPSVFALSPLPFPDFRVNAPHQIRRGETARIGLSPTSSSPAGTHVLHVEVTDPSGKTVRYYSGNVIAPGGTAEKAIPFAANDATGKWTVHVKDLLSGQERTETIELL